MEENIFIINTYPKIEAVVDSPLSKSIFTGGHAPVRPPPLLCNGQKINAYHIIKKNYPSLLYPVFSCTV